jgi:4-hydroxy-3-methylbut-2-enyl diphosphate reductase
LRDAAHVGVTAGASAPEHLVQDVLAWLRAHGASVRETEIVREDVQFALPAEILAARRAAASVPRGGA